MCTKITSTQHSVKVTDLKPQANNLQNNYLPGYTPVVCHLKGTKICEYPECTGFDNRFCDNWKKHSGR